MAVMPQMRLWVAVEPVDFRKGIDGLVAVCRQRLAADPMSGAVFIFGSRNRKSIKLLAYDGQGFWLFQTAIARPVRLVAGRGRSGSRAAGGPSDAGALVERGSEPGQDGTAVAAAGRLKK